MPQRFFAFLLGLFALCHSAYAIDASKLLPPEAAFVPQVQAGGSGLNVQFQIADGYYLYQAKLEAQTDPDTALGAPVFSPAEEKEDEFFGRQPVYYHAAQILWPYTKTPDAPYRLTLTYQGCADVGVCYPPAQISFDITGEGLYRPPAKAANPFTAPAARPPVPDSGRFTLSRDTLGRNLAAFFFAGLGLSFTACMYPLIPIVSGIVVGWPQSGKRRAFVLTLLYTQGLALTYTLAGVLAGITGSLLTVWLQQAWVVLAAAAVMVVLALSMFGVFNLQLPAAWQSYFQQQSNRLSGGRAASVFGMGMLSALIVGPCVAPPLAFALGYIGQTGDAALGGIALYAMAVGTGLPLILIGTFGAHLLPKAGAWMNTVKYAFGFLLLGVAVYLASGFLPYALSAALYTLLLLVPAVLLLAGRLKTRAAPTHAAAAACTAGILLLAGGIWFGIQSARGQTTALHSLLSLYPQQTAAVQRGLKTDSVAELKAAIDRALREEPDTPVLLDFYADWCVACKQMEARTLNDAAVARAVPMRRFFTIDLTANTPEHQALLKEYGLFGPPGIFVLKSSGSRSEPLLGFVKPQAFIDWYRENAANP
ncbi:protein-disulfide reductase DsbD [Neisseria leonii]|uniref:Thiol:disulfide interchange protein DsbD n=1 Tax=Neisseria leonii TaxID=2995413 RepID=A0A9X4E104_9NEIS|nr:protein-disulfide reductase DsbD [Neisseria sp. 51.81]MDD9327513.1 protein-disulfide reductase DsbD [Neisseria sp. 51.81]